MNQKFKAALLSSLLFPGAGQFLAKKYFLAVIFSGIAFISLSILMVNIIQRSLAIAEKIQHGSIPFDVMAISKLLLQQPTINSSSIILTVASIVLVLVWITSIIESLITAP